MNLMIQKDYEAMSLEAARLIGAQVRLYPTSVLGLATGSTPIGCYQELIRMHREEGLDFSAITTINLDEYIGLGPDHEQSYRYFMNEHFFSHINIQEEETHVPSGIAEDPDEEAMRYEEMIEMLGGIDLQLLGIGPNGHFGFNEPADFYTAESHRVQLTENTIDANSRFFESREEVPKQAITLGVGQIMKAAKIILLVNGKHKAEALKNSLMGPITPRCPASILQIHPDLTVICDEEAASLLLES